MTKPQQPDLSRLKIDWREAKASPHSNRRIKRLVVWISLAVIISIGILTFFRFGMDLPEVTVTAVTLVHPAQAMTVLNASGYVVAQRRASVASKATGRLVELKVKEGDKVTKGQILARLESADVAAVLSRAKANHNVARSALEQAKAELNEATLSYERKKGLLKSGLISQAEFDAVEGRYLRARAAMASAEAGIHAAQAAVEAAQVDMENTIIRAPFDGTVLAKNAEVGEVVAPFGSSTLAKAAVVTMADMASLQVEADVSESNLEKIHVGQRCEIILDAYPDTRYEGIVDTILPTADRAKATVMTKIRFLNRDERVLPEMSAKVAFLSEPASQEQAQQAIAVHPGAIVLRGEQKVAFLITGDRVSKTRVEVGRAVGNLVEVKSGLKPGDRVVMNPSEKLADGDRIQITQ